MKILLRDIKQEMCNAWTHFFKGIEDVEVSCGHILKDVQADAIVSPANSYGFMDGGIDAIYTMHWGQQMQDRLQELLRNEYDGELPVGEAVIIETGGDDIKWLISAPTMRVPMPVDKTVNAYLAFRAILRTVKKWNKKYHQATRNQINTILCPGLGTAVGQMPYHTCAKQMFFAYVTVVLGKQQQISDLTDAWALHDNLVLPWYNGK